MTFYIENFLQGSSDAPSVAILTLPDKTEITALISNDITVQLTNRFGNLLPGTETLAGLAQALGAVNIPSWIGASVQGWRGTDPIKFSLELFLVNYRPNLGYEEKLKSLARLGTISRANKGNILDHITHQVHGGYETDASAFASNLQFLDRNPNNYFEGNIDGNTQQDQYQRLETLGEAVESPGRAKFKGTISIKIGHRFRLSELIMTSLAITPSVVEVYSPTAGERPKPLYYRLSLGLMTCRAALATDVDLMFS